MPDTCSTVQYVVAARTFLCCWLADPRNSHCICSHQRIARIIHSNLITWLFHNHLFILKAAILYEAPHELNDGVCRIYCSSSGVQEINPWWTIDCKHSVHVSSLQIGDSTSNKKMISKWNNIWWWSTINNKRSVFKESRILGASAMISPIAVTAGPWNSAKRGLNT